MFNAMTFTDVKSFALSLLQEVTEKKTSVETERLGRQLIDEEEVAKRVAKALSFGNDRNIKKWNHLEPKHNIIVIDEVDQFSVCEKGLTLLVQTILRSKQFSQTNTSIIGIANSVDLPFRKKHSAIAMRDCQLLFKPYSTDQIVDILECKFNGRFKDIPSVIREDNERKKLFFELIDDRAYEFIAKKVSKQNGDIRVAFDLMKSALSLLSKRTRKLSTLPPVPSPLSPVLAKKTRS